jgi:hypothetical protein
MIDKEMLTGARWVGQRAFDILAWMPETFSPTSVELWHTLGELEARTTRDFAGLEVSTRSPSRTLRRSSLRVGQSRTEFS